MLVESNRFVVCNPSVRKIFGLPQRSYSKRVAAYGFCYLPSRNRHVIVAKFGDEWRIITFLSTNNLETLLSSFWKPIKNNLAGETKGFVRGVVFSNGFLYWTRSLIDGCFCLHCFDLYEEKFFTVECDNEILCGYWYSVSDLKGDLHLMAWGNLSCISLNTLWKTGSLMLQLRRGLNSATFTCLSRI
ncbi:hypothetical protein F511_41051 [Dorcoceras hygrometricum]|uniref:F-box associated beta-propeller type 3 domain-containing protein n=1 Tax=Dorcoceras hygrometricum TaxID=472368 RepID=A0A2Z7A6W8_9LAMI|nr:hypothetical protein F511_41051 [Dorcoceras hygrometricum]